MLGGLGLPLPKHGFAHVGVRFPFTWVLNPCLCGSVIRAADDIIRAAWTALHDGHISQLAPAGVSLCRLHMGTVKTW